ncbi:MAG: SDR family NAD(P)-dependent oxidoreductase, partial [Cyanobacteria bacterium J06638_6]
NDLLINIIGLGKSSRPFVPTEILDFIKLSFLSAITFTSRKSHFIVNHYQYNAILEVSVMRQLVIVTGAIRGLGYALTQRLLSEGMNVVAMGRQVDNL